MQFLERQEMYDWTKLFPKMYSMMIDIQQKLDEVINQRLRNKKHRAKTEFKKSENIVKKMKTTPDDLGLLVSMYGGDQFTLFDPPLDEIDTDFKNTFVQEIKDEDLEIINQGQQQQQQQPTSDVKVEEIK